MFGKRWVSLLGIAVSGCVLLAVTLPVVPVVRSAEQEIDLDGNALNGKESRVVTRVLQSYPVKIENVIHNNAAGQSFLFQWGGAGPGGFDSIITPGPDVGTKWEWTTLSQVYSILSPAVFVADDRGIPTVGGQPGAIQAGADDSVFTLPGKSILPTTVTVSGASLTSSLVTFFSPEKQIASCGGSFTPGRYEQTITNNSGGMASFNVEQQDCCPEAQMTICEDGCQFYLTDSNNCGGCGIQCAADESCSQGFCECTDGLSSCDDTCVDLEADPNNCGTCGNTCAADQFCGDGVCQCPAGQTLCGDSCVDLEADPDNCGACGNVCALGASCNSGVCECPTGQTACGDSCVDLQIDPLNCGACGNTCGSNDICAVGTCETCRPPLQTACDNECVNIHTNPFNCGACGNVCDFSDCPSSGTGTCSQGSSCVCDVAQASTAEPLSFSPISIPQARQTRAVRRQRVGRSERRAPARLEAAVVRGLAVVEAPVCDLEPVQMMIEDGESFTQCFEGARVGKEVFMTATVQRDGETIGQGPCAVIVPDPQAFIPPFLPATVNVDLHDQSGDGLFQPGESGTLWLTVANLGDSPFENPVGRLSSRPDAFNPLPLEFLSDTSAYSDFPAFETVGDCTTESQLETRTNLLGYSVAIPFDHEADVGRVYELELTADGGTGESVDMTFVVGIGEACDPTSELDGETYDGLAGFLEPVDAMLVPLNSPVQFSTSEFNQGKTIPLKLKLRCGDETLGPEDIDPAPQIVKITHDTLGPQPLTAINADNGANPGDPFFACGTNRCEYQFRTVELPEGSYVIEVKLPDTRIFHAGFTLRP